jgi:hypothetical protein
MKYFILTISIAFFCCKQNAKIINPEKHFVKQSYDELKITEKEYNLNRELNPALISDSLIKKSDGKLTLLTVNHKHLILIDNNGFPYDENRISYNYIGYITAINKYLIEVMPYEDKYYILFDKTNGRIDTISGFPVLSPDNDLIYTAHYNPYETYENVNPPTYDINIYKIDAGSVSLLFSKYYKSTINEQYWQNNHSFCLKLSNENNVKAYFYKKITIE